MSKYILIILALFGLNALADVHGNMETGSVESMPSMVSSVEMTDMKEMSKEGLMGSFALRYKPMGFAEPSKDVTYRARVGWSGQVNDAVNWGVAVSTAPEQNFASGFSGIALEQAYVSYNPVEGLYIKAGKIGWIPDFNKVGVFMSEQLYLAGVGVKYQTDMSDAGNFYAKVYAYDLTGAAPLSEGFTIMGKLGVEYEMSDIDTGVYVKGIYDGLLKEEGTKTAEGEEATEATASASAKTLAQAGINVGTSSMLPVPVGVFALGSSDVSDFVDALNWTAGVYVGSAGKPDSVEMGDFGVSVSYYDLNPAGYVSSWLNEDYVNVANTAESKGIAARGQYNPWDNVSLAVKVAQDLDKKEDATNVVAELMFVF